MHELTETDKNKLWQEVKQEFPDDEMMQEIHYIRLLHYHRTKNLPNEERLQLINRGYKKKSKG